MRASGASLDVIAKKFNVNRDSVWRHYGRHVSAETKAYLLAGPVKLEALAELAAAERLSLLQYLQILRSTLMSMFQQSAQQGSAHNASITSGRLIQVLNAIGRLTGEMEVVAQGGTQITNNTLVIGSPGFAKVHAVILAALAAFPEARLAVVDALRDMEEAEAGQVLPHRPEMKIIPTSRLLDMGELTDA
jgi:hypothetical protein